MDSEAQIVSCLHAALADLGEEPMADDAVRNIIGLGLREAIDTLVPGRSDDFHQAFVEAYRAHWFTSESSMLFAGARETLEIVKQSDYLLGVATGKARRGLDRVLNDTGLATFFHATRCADEAPSKPHPQMLLDLMEALDVLPEETIMVGDTEYDMEMATNAGVAKIAVRSGVHSGERLDRHAPLVCLDRVADMPDWMGAMGLLSAAVVERLFSQP